MTGAGCGFQVAAERVCSGSVWPATKTSWSCSKLPSTVVAYQACMFNMLVTMFETLWPYCKPKVVLSHWKAGSLA